MDFEGGFEGTVGIVNDTVYYRCGQEVLILTRRRVMGRFEFVSFDKESCANGCRIQYKDNGKLMATERGIIKSACDIISEKHWGVDDIYWVFLPGKMFDDEEKRLFLEMLNPHYLEIRDKCRRCIGYAELNGVPLEGEPLENSSDNILTEDEVEALSCALTN